MRWSLRAVLVTFALIGASIPIAAGQSPKSESNGVGSGVPISSLPGNAAAGKKVFVQFCGKCHTMAAAATHGSIGPNLDQDVVNFDRVITAVDEGIGGIQAEYTLQRSCSAALGPRCVTFKQLYNVAKFVVADRKR